MRLDGAVTLVTGASSGIGAEIARHLARAGSTPLLAGRDEARLADIAAVTGGTPLVEDLAVPGGPARLADRALAVTGRVDLVVYSAGVGWAGSVTQMAAADVERLVRTNLQAPVELTRSLAPHMIERGCGWMAFVASIAGATGVGEEAAYAGTKGGVAMFADSLRYELAGKGVGVTVVVPGVVDTPFFSNRNIGYQRRWPRPIPAARIAEALIGAVRAGRREVFVPRWMAIPARLRGAAPGLYGTLARRFG